MNTNILKRFAQEARTKLMQQVAAKLDFVLTTDTPELREKQEQIKNLKKELEQSSKQQVIEKVAYTWFNRLMALRFMDANDYQPLGLRVISPIDGYTLPELLSEAKQGNIPEDLHIDSQKVLDLLDGRLQSQNPQNEAFRLLLVASCNHLNNILPFLFERIEDYTELLLPDDLTSEFSIVQDVINGMSTEDCQQVEIIGWLYQFYISERKDVVFASKGKVSKEDIPAATQLFTPRWIVEYMVQNTLGKLWLQNHPESGLKGHMPYYIESASAQSEDYLKINSPEEIKLVDPACGSGHILVYAFDLLTKIYEEQGYNQSEIPGLIIQNNLYGLEIDERASQLASMALMMKAREYNRRVFRRAIQPNINCYVDLHLTDKELEESISLAITPSQELSHDLRNMQQATNLGSLIIPHAPQSELERALEMVQFEVANGDMFTRPNLQKLQTALKQLLVLGQKYHAVVANPPYMGSGKMNPKLSDFVKAYYPDSKADLMTCFMESSLKMLLGKGILGMINLPSWLFLSSFEKLRSKLIKEKHIDSLLHMGRGIFGVDWGSTAFIITNSKTTVKGDYFKLHKRNFQHIYPEDIRDIFLEAKNDAATKIDFDKYRDGVGTTSVKDLIDSKGLQISYTANQDDFEKIPGSPIGYWASEVTIDIFDSCSSMNEETKARQGISTADNERFLRTWQEIAWKKSSLNNTSSPFWFPHNKGGSFRKWYGNQEYFINWMNDGFEIKNFYNDKGQRRSVIRNPKYYFEPSVSWSDVNSGSNAFRIIPKGFIHNGCAPSAFGKDEDWRYCLLAYGNLKYTSFLVNLINPTIHFSEGYFSKLPFPSLFWKKEVLEISKKCVQISKYEWDSKELSWGFQRNELLKIKGQDLEETYDLYQQYWNNKFVQLHSNEEELNRQFMEIYGLQEELTPDVPLEEITILKDETKIENGDLVFNAKEVIAQFVSYAVGCMFGRYSLDKEGLILANQGETLEDYLAHTERSRSEVSFMPDDDNIIPILEDEWFEDDIAGRFKEFLKASFGTDNFEKNLAFLEECLGKDIRKYFIKDFYADHIKRYKKRPIYWMFSSPKGAFNVLIYMHRYTPDTVSNILNGYLREYQDKLKTSRENWVRMQVSGTAAEKNKAVKEIDKIDKILLELNEYEREVLFPLATDRISIDLDDGVLVNYNKFGKAIKPVAGLNDAKTKKKVRGFDWIDVEEIRD